MKIIINSAIFFVLFIIFRNWFLNNVIIGGDWPYYFPKHIQQFSLFAPSWVSYIGNGFGGTLLLYALDSYAYFVTHIFVKFFQPEWDFIGKIFFFYSFLGLSIWSGIYFFRVVFDKYTSYYLLAGISVLLITTNTYVLMLVGGGQMGVALAYAVSPLTLGVFLRFIKVVQKENVSYLLRIKYLLLSGISLGVCMIFDSRIAYLLALIIGLFYLFQLAVTRLKTFSVLTFFYLFGAGMIALLLNSFWIIPTIVYGNNPIDQVVWTYGSVGFFQFLSFADFSQALALLHPNWPENIFGKVYFMKPEFLIIPILAYSSLLFLKNSFSRYIVFFSLLGILGSFMGKGTHAPFGWVNEYLFSTIPGFGLFRDPTKFYMLTVLAYSVLIPFSLAQFTKLIGNKFKFDTSKKKKILFVIPISFILFYLFSIHQVFTGQLGGTFAKKQIPQEYIRLADYISNQRDFFRTLWIPRQQRFNYYSNTHPAVGADTLFKTSTHSAIVQRFAESLARGGIQNMSIKYVIIPSDTEGEIFLEDRKYDEKQHKDLVQQISKIPGIDEISGFGNIHLFEIPNPKGHFFVEKGQIRKSSAKSSTLYELILSTDAPTTLHFIENYSPYWKLRYGDVKVPSIRSKAGFNSFDIQKTGVIHADLYYAQEKGYAYSRLISGIVLLLFITGIFLVKTKY